MKKSLLFSLGLLLVACGQQPKDVNVESQDSIQQADSIVANDTVPQDSLSKQRADMDSIVTAAASEYQAPDAVDVIKRYQEEEGSHMKANHSGERVIYLTFDDGPSSTTPKVLEILRREGVKATFFVTAQSQSSLKYIRDAYREGHAIAAHTYSHSPSIYKSPETYFADLDKIQSVIKEYTGTTTKIIRFPGGSSNTMYYRASGDPLMMIRLTQAVRDRGYQYVDWNVSSEDATGANVPVETIIRSSCKRKDSDICLLMHDTSSKKTTIQALPQIIQFYKNLGYRFGTLTSTSYVCHHGIRPFGSKGRGKTNNAKKQSTTQPTTQATAKKSADNTVSTPQGQPQTNNGIVSDSL